MTHANASDFSGRLGHYVTRHMALPCFLGLSTWKLVPTSIWAIRPSHCVFCVANGMAGNPAILYNVVQSICLMLRPQGAIRAVKL
jgi:hypothetical protein